MYELLCYFLWKFIRDVSHRLSYRYTLYVRVYLGPWVLGASKQLKTINLARGNTFCKNQNNLRLKIQGLNLYWKLTEHRNLDYSN